MNKKIIRVDWESFNSIVNEMAKEIERLYKPDFIISVARGGMIPSVIISHRLNIRNVKNIVAKETISDDVYAIKEEPIVDFTNLEEIADKKVLIVDDILGSGETIRKVKEKVQMWKPREVKTAICIVNKDNWEKSNRSEFFDIIDFIGKEVRGWVVFPWED